MSDAADIAREAARTGAVNAGLISIAAGESMRQFRERALLAGAIRSPMLGMSRSEIGRYCVGRALDMARVHGHDPGSRALFTSSFEGEIHQELVKRFGECAENTHTMNLPLDVVAHYAQRDLNTSTAGAGGFLVETSVNGFVELAQPQSVILRLGASLIEGLRDSVILATEKTPVSVQALPTQTSEPTESTPQFGAIALLPKDLGAYTEVSRTFMQQTSESAQRFIIRQLLAAVGTKIDQLALQGTGSGGEFLGILNVPGIGTVTGASLALAGVLEFQTDTGDRLGPNGGYVMTRAIGALLAARQKATGTSTFLWEGNLYEGQVGGFRAMTTSNMPAGAALFGNWDQLVVASWGTLAVQVNPFSGFRAGIMGLRVIHSCDTAVRDPVAFSAAQGVT